MKDSIISYTFLFLAEIVIMVIGAAAQVMWLFYLFLALILIEAVLISIRLIIKYEFKCKKCGTVFNPSVKEKLFGINSGDVKKAVLPALQSKTMVHTGKKDNEKELINKLIIHYNQNL